MTVQEIVRGLRYEQKKREHDFVGTCETNISAMCKDAADLIESLQDELANYNCDTKIGCKLIEAVKAERDAAVEDMKLIVDAVREEHCDETCCFACKFDCDTSITDSGCYANECPGFERDDCFEWRGAEKKGDKRSDC